ncbi:MAG TPA: response regulator [Ktedonobacteraceae bacterium]|nr:response regulator [Ktedonobacteraceae bacterium]
MSKHILIVEDNEAIGDMLKLLFEDENTFQCTLARDSMEAIDYFKEIDPDLLLLDYLLPGMNGICLYDHLCKMKNQAMPSAIMISANLPYKDLAQRNISGINKPFDWDLLLSTILSKIA